MTPKHPITHPHGVIVVFALLFLVWGGLLYRAGLSAQLQSFVRPANHISDAEPASQIIPQQPTQTARQVGVDCAKERCLALTFDDGPNPIATPMILDVLERQHVSATFFVLGMRAVNQRDTLRRMYANGNEIGNHSWGHPDMTKLSASDIADQVNRTQTAVASAGVPAPRLFRPPYGAVNSMMRATIPMTFAMWNVDPLDWEQKDPAKIKDNILAEAKPGGVLDLHDIYLTTAQALEPAIVELKKQYHLVTYSQLFNLQAGQRGEYFGR